MPSSPLFVFVTGSFQGEAVPKTFAKTAGSRIERHQMRLRSSGGVLVAIVGHR